MTSKIYKIIKTIIVIVFFLTFNTITVYTLQFLGLNFNNMNKNTLSITCILIEIVEILLLFFIYYNDMVHDLKDFKENFKKYLKFGLKWWTIGLILMYVSNIIVYLITLQGASNEEILQEQIIKLPLYMLFSSSITAPFTEEVVFRKSIRDVFSNNILFIVVSFLVFGGMHVLTSSSLIEVLYIIPYGIFGAIFAYMYVKTDNIFTSISIHALHNFIIVSFSIISMLLGV